MKKLAFILCFLLAGTAKAEFPDGTLIFLENTKYLVEAYTDSPTTHVAIIMHEDGVPYVYEAEPPRVRRMPLKRYFSIYAGTTMCFMKPIKLFRKSVEMKGYLDDQLGRRYSIKGYFQGSSDGTHCSQLVSNTLNVSGKFNFDQPCKISPATLKETIVDFYKEKKFVPKPVKKKSKATWCGRSYTWWARSFRWCRWSCEETWRWCW